MHCLYIYSIYTQSIVSTPTDSLQYLHSVYNIYTLSLISTQILQYLTVYSYLHIVDTLQYLQYVMSVKRLEVEATTLTFFTLNQQLSEFSTKLLHAPSYCHLMRDTAWGIKLPGK